MTKKISILPGLLPFVIGLVLSSASLTFSNHCIDNRSEFEKLPSSIGTLDNKERYLFSLGCDTVLIPQGQTTEVLPGTFLYFSKPSPTNIIQVQGTLILKGNKEKYVLLAGGRDSKKNEPVSNKILWGGIIVESGGRLEIEYSGFYGAPTPITAFTDQVKIFNTFFSGGTGMIRPDGTLFELEPQFSAINFLDFAHFETVSQKEQSGIQKNVILDQPWTDSTKSDKLSEGEKQTLLGKERPTWKRPRTLVYLGGGVVVLTTLSYWVSQNKETPYRGPINPALDIKPDPIK